MRNTGWSLLDAIPKCHVINDEFVPFEANAVGQFSAIPEPATYFCCSAGFPLDNVVLEIVRG